ncbi:hypothetical protein ACJ5NB_001241 [Vibrio alginolyticus]
MSEEEIKAYQEKILDDLLNVFDEQIGEEQQIRSEILERVVMRGGLKMVALMVSIQVEL